MATAKEEVNVSKMYGEQCTLPKDEFIKKYRVNEKGLSSKKANELIHNLMRHIDSITAKLNKLQHEGDKVDRPKRFICRVRKIRKTVHS